MRPYFRSRQGSISLALPRGESAVVQVHYPGVRPGSGLVFRFQTLPSCVETEDSRAAFERGLTTSVPETDRVLTL